MTKKDKKNVAFIKKLKETEEYQSLMVYLEETKLTKNHPKLKKLFEILERYFSDAQYETSKVIVFS